MLNVNVIQIFDTTITILLLNILAVTVNAHGLNVREMCALAVGVGCGS